MAIALGVILLLVGLIFIIISFPGDSFGAFVFGMLMFIGGISVLFFNSHPDPAKKDGVVVMNSGQPADDVNVDIDDNASDENTADNTTQDKTSVAKDDSGKKEDDSKKFDWQKWADDNVKSAIISCSPDGIQVYVVGSQDTDDPEAGPGAIAVWPRLHQNGVPFTCAEGKDPQEELKR